MARSEQRGPHDNLHQERALIMNDLLFGMGNPRYTFYDLTHSTEGSAHLLALSTLALYVAEPNPVIPLNASFDFFAHLPQLHPDMDPPDKYRMADLVETLTVPKHVANEYKNRKKSFAGTDEDMKKALGNLPLASITVGKCIVSHKEKGEKPTLVVGEKDCVRIGMFNELTPEAALVILQTALPDIPTRGQA